MGSRSMRAGINWLVLGFCIVGTDTLIDLVDRIGVERLTEGLLRAAGLMSTMTSRVASQSLRACELAILGDAVGRRPRECRSEQSRAGSSTGATRRGNHSRIKRWPGFMRSRLPI